MKRTFSIRNLLAIVAVIAGGLGSMRVASHTLVIIEVAFLILIVLTAVLGSIVTKSSSWTGFATFSVGGPTFFYFFSAISGRDLYDLEYRVIDSLSAELQKNRVPRAPIPKINERFVSKYKSKTREAFGAPDVLGKWTDEDLSMLTSEEIRLLEDYEDAREARSVFIRHYGDLITNMRTIGNAWLTILLGLIGSFLGQYFDAKRRCIIPSPSA